VEPLVLYSTNTRLAYVIAQRFYRSVHYVWCVPNAVHPHGAAGRPNPPSSDPLKIYRVLWDAVRSGDRHCAEIKQKKLGLLRGAEAKKKEGVIDEATFRTIVEMVEGADLDSFQPLLYVIPAKQVADQTRSVPPRDRAAVLSEELLIAELEASNFDVLVLPL
jgi:hypothetical protein